MPKENFKKQVEELTEKLKKCEEEKEGYLKGWKRAKADFVNYKKEENDRILERISRRQESIFYSLIMVLDSFDLSILSSNEAKIDKKGVELIRNQLFDVLKREGLEKIEIDIGDDFDPNISEAVERVESDYESGKVVEEVEKGYKFKNKVIRPSKVKISKD
jgi:molecular chaperone GrpE